MRGSFQQEAPHMPAPSAPQNLGRFELQKPLGRGAQGEVWLALDPRLQRQVAIKRLLQRALDANVLERWLGEARAVGRLSHPNIVPLYEADLEGVQPFLVFELVKGETLAQHLKKRGALPEAEALKLMQGVLDGLRHAHEAGVIHRDLKPGNIMVEVQGRPRIMDFGLAVVGRQQVGNPGVSGTVGYLAPEAAAGAVPTPAVDVFAAGMVLYEVLTGQPAIKVGDARQAVYQLATQDVQLPSGVQVSQALRAVVNRALARDPGQRYPDAGSLAQALAACAPAQEALPVAGETGAGNATLEFLLRRMQHKGDFPALSDAVMRIQKLTQSDDENLASLANEILKDVALTHKILRMVNSSYYRRPDGGAISTISRAIALLGLSAIRNLALSLVLMEHMQDKKHAAALKEEFFRGLMAGLMAHELCPTAREAEESFIGALFQNLGRMLTRFYFPEEAEQIQRELTAVMATAPGDLARPVSLVLEESACRKVLGIGYQDLAVGVGRAWGLPEGLLKAMHRISDDVKPDAPKLPADRQRLLASAANELTQAMLATDPARDGGRHLTERQQQIQQRYGAALGWSDRTVHDATQKAQSELQEWARTLQLPMTAGSAGARLAGLNTPAVVAAATAPDTHNPAVLAGVSPEFAAADDQPDNTAAMLSAGIADISNTLVGSFKLQEVVRMILETLYRALSFQRVVFCLRDTRSGLLTGRVTIGMDSGGLARAFVIRTDAAADVFSAIAIKGVDTLITDTHAGGMPQRLPKWFHDKVQAPTFLLLPLHMKGAPIGMIYADKAQAGGIVLAEREMSLVRALRNQALMALRHGGH